MAVTADQASQTRKLENAAYDVVAITSGATVYVGALASFDASGTLVNATDTASTSFAGEVVRIINESGSPISSGTGNAGGTVKAEIRYGHQMRLNVGAAARLQANLGKTVCISDNVTVLGATATNDIKCGRLEAFDGSTSYAWVTLRAEGTAAAA